MDLNFVELAYKRSEALWITTRDYIDWADELLEGGSNAPSIAELSSCRWDGNPDAQQVERIFQSCLLELGLTLPNDWYDALLSYTSSLCEKVLSGTIAPWDFVREMLTLADDNNDPYMLWIWIDLGRDIPSAHPRDQGDILFNGALDLNNADDCIRKTAQQYIYLCTLPLATKFPFIWWCHVCDEISDEDTFTENKTFTCNKCGAISGMKNMRFFEHRDALVKKAAMISAINQQA